MQARHQRRKRLTPIVNPRNENFWVRAMEGMGLQPLHSKKQPVAIMGQEASIAIDAPVPAPSDTVAQSRKTTILDLPNETQKAIFEHCSPPDLLSLALVSKHFRDIAAEHLYRSFHIVFPAYDDSDSDSPTDALASGLETFVTSEYDYGQYVREIVLEPSSGRDHGHNAYREYLTDTSCGKFLNTLLVLTLRKTKALESFKWDIRIELSRQTFKALHDLKALQHLQIRLHAGNSIYNTSPSMPIVPTTANNSFSPFLHPAPPSFTFPPLNPLPIVQSHPIMDGNSGPSSSQFVAGIKTKYKQSKAGLLTSVKPRPTLSGFKNLTSLAVLDMDTLDYISEINQCIVHSWTTLKTLRLSFSETLSNKSRKPAPEIHSDDESDQDDDFTQLVPVPPGVPPPTGPPPPAAPLSSSNDAPTKALKAMEERKKQEAVLAQLLGIDPAIPEPPSPPVPEEMLSEDSKKLLLKDMAPLGKVLLKIIKDGENGRDLGNDALENIAKASKLILETSKLILERGEKKGSSSEPETGGEPDATLKTVPDPPTEAVEDKASENESTERGLFDEPEAKDRQKTDSDSDVANPDDIDVEAPELPESTSEVETVESEDPQDVDEAANESESKSLTHSKASDSKSQSDKSSSGQIPIESQDYTYYLAERKRLQDLIEDLINKRDTIKGMEAEDWQKLENLRTAIDSFLHEMARLDLSFKEKLGGGKTPSTSDDTVEKMSEYVRKTRGLNLDALAIHLIPIKSVVLMRAINVRVLTSITLLRVGHQNLFWASLAKENKISPLPLRNIYSDNITLHFLALVHQLECVEELLMVERKQNVLLESITPKTTVTIDQIRRTVLKKHLGTLKVLMIQNDDTPDWDMNTETAVLICRRGKELEELAVSFGIRTMHTLLQFMPGLTKLRALHTLIFRHDDTCMWVMREFRKFAVDIISHNPHMKLEWLALGETVVRLVREIPKKVDKKGKGKAKQGIGKGKTLADLVSSAQPLGGPPTQATLSLLNMGISPNMMLTLDDSDDEDLRIGGKNGLIVETITGVEFSDVPGVRIFETDALIGRL